MCNQGQDKDDTHKQGAWGVQFKEAKKNFF